MRQIGAELGESPGQWGQLVADVPRVLVPLLTPGLMAGLIYIFVVWPSVDCQLDPVVQPGKRGLSILIFEQYENGEFTVLSALGVVMVLRS